MLTEQLDLLYPVVAVFLLVAVLVLYVHYTSDRQYRIKILLAPALLTACAFTVPLIGTRLGYGWPTPLPTSFQYLAHKTVVVDGEKRWMDVMLVSREPLDPRSRLHRVRWNRELEKVLEEAERMKEGRDGGDIVVTSPSREGGGGEREGGHSAIRVLPGDRMPKDAVPTQRLPESPPRPLLTQPGTRARVV